MFSHARTLVIRSSHVAPGLRGTLPRDDEACARYLCQSRRGRAGAGWVRSPDHIRAWWPVREQPWRPSLPRSNTGGGRSGETTSAPSLVAARGTEPSVRRPVKRRPLATSSDHLAIPAIADRRDDCDAVIPGLVSAESPRATPLTENRPTRHSMSKSARYPAARRSMHYIQTINLTHALLVASAPV
jgi:hypothetical protein